MLTVASASPLTYPSNTDSLIKMSDDELAEVEGQALFSLGYLAPTDPTNHQGGNVGFYTLSLEANIDLNANIKNLQLGCGGTNGSNNCDIDISNMSFGCIANASGSCITLPKTDSRQPNGAVQELSAGKSEQSQMKDFNLTNPFFQFAIKNPDSAATREIVGMRVGAAQAKGPLSFGALNMFSGYLTGKANLVTQRENEVGVTTESTSRYKGLDAYLGLSDGTVLDINLLLLGRGSVKYRDVSVNYDGIARNDLDVVVAGNRLNQAEINGLEFGSIVDEVMRSLALADVNVNVCILIACTDVGLASGSLDGVKGAILNILEGQITNKIKLDLANGLAGQNMSGYSSTQIHQWLNSYRLPFNLNNVHQLEVDSKNFGIALSKQSLQYPNYASAVNEGWSMYLPDAFTLNINDKLSNLVNNISSLPDARNGNITMLQAPYRNCYGSLTFC